MKFKARNDASTTVLLGVWTTGWLAGLVYSLLKGSISYKTGRGKSSTVYMAEEPLIFFVWIAIMVGLVCLGACLMLTRVPPKSDAREDRS